MDQNAYLPGSEVDFRVNVGHINHFDTGSDNLSLDTMDRLQKQAEWANKFHIPGLLIEGHCDSSEGSREHCLVLGERRALQARHYMSQFYDSRRISIMSWGKERPIAPESSIFNSRIETILLWNEDEGSFRASLSDKDWKG